jgi:hypothetical protein
MARTAVLPILTAEPGLTHYFEEIRRFPILERQEEYMLANRWREHSDREAAHKLVASHLRLVAKIAMGYRGYGLPISEVISEGNVGRDWTAWLGWEDSNRGIRHYRNPPAWPPKFSGNPPKLRRRDFSRSSCGVRICSCDKDFARRSRHEGSRNIRAGLFNLPG